MHFQSGLSHGLLIHYACLSTAGVKAISASANQIVAIFVVFILHRVRLGAYVITVFLNSRRTEISACLTSRDLRVNTVKRETSSRTGKSSDFASV